MIRVAFGVNLRVFETSHWIGGKNYYRNLISALLQLPEKIIDPIILGGKLDHPEPINTCKQIPLAPSLRRFSLLRFKDWSDNTILGNGGILSQHLKNHGIDLLSHGPCLGTHSPVPAMCWIADFQHLHYPEYFSKDEILSRNRKYGTIAKKAQAVLLSSQHAKSEFCKLYPEESSKAFVLNFVSSISQLKSTLSVDDINLKFNINEPYFHVPNQIWRHKNHLIIVKALRILKDRVACPLIVCTGNTHDYRNPNFFDALKRYIHELGLDDRIRFLGLIPFVDMAALMKYSLAIINPSLFEGWSTSVEEAKSMGKSVILSDIPVHREQAPERGIFFSSEDAEALADAMKKSIELYNEAKEKSEMMHAINNLPERINRFALRYVEIVRQVVQL
jgi:glycosyltransferase involved in cell wall biosynthesis